MEPFEGLFGLRFQSRIPNHSFHCVSNDYEPNLMESHKVVLPALIADNLNGVRGTMMVASNGDWPMVPASDPWTI